MSSISWHLYLKELFWILLMLTTKNRIHFILILFHVFFFSFGLILFLVWRIVILLFFIMISSFKSTMNFIQYSTNKLNIFYIVIYYVECLHLYSWKINSSNFDHITMIFIVQSSQILFHQKNLKATLFIRTILNVEGVLSHNEWFRFND